MFWAALRQLGITDMKVGALFLGVRVGGELPWEGNTRDRYYGLPRIIATNDIPLTQELSWRDYRKRLQGKLPLDELGSVNPAYCAVGRGR
jgi:hypothetical protein